MINININSDEPNVNDFLLVWDKFQSRPNQIIIHDSYDYDSFLSIVEMSSVNVVSEFIPLIDDYTVNDRLLSMISDNIYLTYIILEKERDESIITELTFFYKNFEDDKEILEIIDNLRPFIITESFEIEKTGSLNVLSVADSNLLINNLEISEQNFDSFYSKTTNKEVSNLVKKIKKSKNGLSIFYGEKGTGKTNMIKNISKIINKDIFFIPNNIIEHTITNPEFVKFLKKNNNSVLIIDDFELIIDNYSRYDSIINGIIQMVDSLISEIINVNIILIFNIDDISDIDDLIYCNNLHGLVNFECLSVNESNKLSDSLGNKTRYKNNSKLIDIIKDRNTSSKKRVGF